MAANDPDAAALAYAAASTMLEECATSTGFADGILRARLKKGLDGIDSKKAEVGVAAVEADAREKRLEKEKGMLVSDAELVKEHLEHASTDLTRLRALCKKQGKDTKGAKATLVARLVPLLSVDLPFVKSLKDGSLKPAASMPEEPGAEPSVGSEETNSAGAGVSDDEAVVKKYLNGARAGDLRSLLDARGFEKSGLKKALVERLQVGWRDMFSTPKHLLHSQ